MCRLLSIFLLFLSTLVHSAFPSSVQGGDDFLPVDQAFIISVDAHSSQINISFTIAPDYYLYQHRFNFQLKTSSGEPIKALGDPVFAAGTQKDDPYFGQVIVYPENTQILLPLTLKNLSGEYLLEVGYQGCAEAGLCYPPQLQDIPIFFPGSPVSSDKEGPLPDLETEDKNNNPGLLAQWLQSASLPEIIGLFLLLGIGLAFTPCVLPMVPILSGIIVGQSQRSTGRALALSLTYVIAMAATYALAGTAVGYFGAKANLSFYLQHPMATLVVASLFVFLALSMFGFYELRLPQRWQQALTQYSNRQGSGYAGVAVMGALSALVVSPCITAPLAGALIYISTTGDTLLGGSALFALGLGMGLPLLLLAMGLARWLPHSGAWMSAMTGVFGLLLLAVSVVLINRLISPQLQLLTWGAWSLALAISCWVARFRLEVKNPLMLTTGIAALVYSIVLVFGSLTGGTSLLNPLASETQQSHSSTYFRTVTSLDEINTLMNQAKAMKQPVVIDFYADWCVSCKVLEKEVFTNPEVIAALSAFVTIKADLSKINSNSQAIMEQFNILGLPAVFMFDRDGREIPSARLLGETTAKKYLSTLNKQGYSANEQETLQ